MKYALKILICENFKNMAVKDYLEVIKEMIHHAKYKYEFIPDDHFFNKFRQEKEDKKDSCFTALTFEEKNQ